MGANELVLYFSIFTGACVGLWIVFVIWSFNKMGELMGLLRSSQMGKEKNTKNKAKHSKIMARKKNKLKTEKELRAARLKEIVQKVKASGL